MSKEKNKLTYLITGAAGFVGFHLSKKLLAGGAPVLGFDNLNDYYDVNLKYSRLKILENDENFTFVKGDLANNDDVVKLFEERHPKIVVHLAAQTGVQYSIDNPRAYIESNVTGFFNILEACRRYPAEHLLYASSSSVYGNQEKIPFSTEDRVDNPISLYAATKKSCELMAHTYSHLYNIPTTGLRLFTAYGPYGRPDMAYFIFTKNIIDGRPVKIFNNGDMLRDFTYIDDIVQVMENMLRHPPKREDSKAPYKLYNIGNNKPERLLHVIETLEKITGKEAKKEFLPMRPGDVYQTYADVSDLANDFGFKPNTPVEAGLQKFVEWYKGYYG